MRAFGFSISIKMAILVYRALAMGVSAGLMLFSGSAIAQVTPDGSVSTTVTQSGNHFTIDNGNRAGNNLFHSFGEFSVPTGGSAIFNNAVDVQNIFSRVTGGNISSIDGSIQVNGTANLFLLNPSGIVFEANASLNVGGSFVGTTANSLKFADGVEFSAVNPIGSPLLTMSVPIGLQMGQNPGDISVRGTGHELTGGFPFPIIGTVGSSPLNVQPGHTLALLGGDIHLNGGVLTSASGQIELGAIGTQNTSAFVELVPNSYGWTFHYTDRSKISA